MRTDVRQDPSSIAPEIDASAVCIDVGSAYSLEIGLVDVVFWTDVNKAHCNRRNVWHRI
jgi:hypothetical protein